MELICVRCGLEFNNLNKLKEHYTQKYCCNPSFSRVNPGRLLNNLFEYEKSIEQNKQLIKDIKKMKRYNCMFCKETLITLKSCRDHMVNCSDKTIFEPDYLSDNDSSYESDDDIDVNEDIVINNEDGSTSTYKIDWNEADAHCSKLIDKYGNIKIMLQYDEKYIKKTILFLLNLKICLKKYYRIIGLVILKFLIIFLCFYFIFS